MKYIIAGSMQDYFNTIKEFELKPSECRYVSSPEQLYGLHNPNIIWGRRAYLSPAKERAEMIMKRR